MTPRINHGLLRRTYRPAARRSSRSAGFSLIELLIVVTIILIIAAIAIPQLMRAKMRANEAAAAENLRTVTTAQITYVSYFPAAGFADDLSKLGGTPGPVTSTSSQILDWVLGCAAQPCPRSGYEFSIESTIGTPPAEYKAVAVPMVVGRTGLRGFCSSQGNVLTVDPNGATACVDPLN